MFLITPDESVAKGWRDNHAAAAGLDPDSETSSYVRHYKKHPHQDRYAYLVKSEESGEAWAQDAQAEADATVAVLPEDWYGSGTAPADQVFSDEGYITDPGVESLQGHTGDLSLAQFLVAGDYISFDEDGDQITISSLAPTEPAGSDREIQFNDAGSFGASAEMTYEGQTLSVPSVETGKVTAQAATASDVALDLQDGSGTSYLQSAPTTPLSITGETYQNALEVQTTSGQVFARVEDGSNKKIFSVENGGVGTAFYAKTDDAQIRLMRPEGRWQFAHAEDHEVKDEPNYFKIVTNMYEHGSGGFTDPFSMDPRTGSAYIGTDDGGMSLNAIGVGDPQARLHVFDGARDVPVFRVEGTSYFHTLTARDGSVGIGDDPTGHDSLLALANDSDKAALITATDGEGQTLFQVDDSGEIVDATIDFSKIDAGAAGSDTQLQVNDSGILSGTPGLTYDGTTLKAEGSGPLLNLAATTVDQTALVLTEQDGDEAMRFGFVRDGAPYFQIVHNGNQKGQLDVGTGPRPVWSGGLKAKGGVQSAGRLSVGDDSFNGEMPASLTVHGASGQNESLALFRDENGGTLVEVQSDGKLVVTPKGGVQPLELYKSGEGDIFRVGPANNDDYTWGFSVASNGNFQFNDAFDRGGIFEIANNARENTLHLGQNRQIGVGTDTLSATITAKATSGQTDPFAVFQDDSGTERFVVQPSGSVEVTNTTGASYALNANGYRSSITVPGHGQSMSLFAGNKKRMELHRWNHVRVNLGPGSDDATFTVKGNAGRDALQVDARGGIGINKGLTVDAQSGQTDPLASFLDESHNPLVTIDTDGSIYVGGESQGFGVTTLRSGYLALNGSGVYLKDKAGLLEKTAGGSTRGLKAFGLHGGKLTSDRGEHFAFGASDVAFDNRITGATEMTPRSGQTGPILSLESSGHSFGFDVDENAGDLVLTDSNGLELIRQPEGGATQFIQGIDVGYPFDLPSDQLTTFANAPVTSAPNAGTEVGYTLAVDNQTVAKVSAEADGSGGVQRRSLKVDAKTDNRDLPLLEVTDTDQGRVFSVHSRNGTLATTAVAGIPGQNLRLRNQRQKGGGTVNVIVGNAGDGSGNDQGLYTDSGVSLGNKVNRWDNTYTKGTLDVNLASDVPGIKVQASSGQTEPVLELQNSSGTTFFSSKKSNTYLQGDSVTLEGGHRKHKLLFSQGSYGEQRVNVRGNGGADGFIQFQSEGSNLARLGYTDGTDANHKSFQLNVPGAGLILTSPDGSATPKLTATNDGGFDVGGPVAFGDLAIEDTGNYASYDWTGSGDTVHRFRHNGDELLKLTGDEGAVVQQALTVSGSGGQTDPLLRLNDETGTAHLTYEVGTGLVSEENEMIRAYDQTSDVDASALSTGRLVLDRGAEELHLVSESGGQNYLVGFSMNQPFQNASDIGALQANFSDLQSEVRTADIHSVSSDYTAASTDAGSILHADTSGGDITLTLPEGLSGKPYLTIRNVGTGTVSLVAGGAASLQTSSSTTTLTRLQQRAFAYYSGGTWYLSIDDGEAERLGGEPASSYARTDVDTVFDENVTVKGNLTVEGTRLEANLETLEIADNLAVLNDGESGDGVTAGFAGWEIDRGTLTSYSFGFDESRDRFVVGQSGSRQVVATREDSPAADGVAVWDSANGTFGTSEGLTYDGTDLLVSGNAVFHAGNHVPYTDADAQAAVTASDVGLGSAENIALSAATWTDMGIARTDVTKSDVGLSNVPNTDIAYSSPIPADVFTTAEVSNLRNGQLADGSTPWSSNNYYDDSDAVDAINAQALLTVDVSGDADTWDGRDRPENFGESWDDANYLSGADANGITTVGESRFINDGSNLPTSGGGYHIWMTAAGDTTNRGAQLALHYQDEGDFWVRNLNDKNWHKVYNTANFTPYDDADARSAVSKGDVGLGNVPNLDPRSGLDMGSNKLTFQPSSSGGQVDGLHFKSNSNTGSDYAKIVWHDDYFGGGEGAALRLVVENDASGSSGPDSIVLDAAGGTYVRRGGLRFTSGLVLSEDASANNLQVGDGSGGYTNMEAYNLYLHSDGVWLGDHVNDSNAHHSRYSDYEARSAVNNSSPSVTTLELSNEEYTDYTSAVGGELVYDASTGVGIYYGSSGSGITKGQATILDTNNTSTGSNLSLTGGASDSDVPGLSLTNNPTFSGTVSASDFNSTSDRRLKTNIAAIDSALQRTRQLRGVTFDWKDGGHSAGVIAQEVEEAFPVAVAEDETGTKRIRTSPLLGLHTQALVDLDEKVDQKVNFLSEEIESETDRLERRIDELEAENAKLRHRLEDLE